jgi:hypothetical protein
MTSASPRLDGLDGGAEAGAVLEVRAAADVELLVDAQERQPFPVAGLPDTLGLLGGTGETLAFAPAGAAHSDDADGPLTHGGER